jgi:hypothetical protein
MRTIGTILIFTVVIALASYFVYDDHNYAKRIFQDEIRSHIVKIERERARFIIHYHQRDIGSFKIRINNDINFGYSNYFYNETFNINQNSRRNIEDKVSVGDSIFKPAKSLLLSVYRKDKAGRKMLVETFKGE